MLELANSLLTIIGSVLTIVSTIVGCFYFLYAKLGDQIDAVETEMKKEFQKTNLAIVNIEKDMLKNSDDRLRRLIAKVGKRVDEFDEIYLKKHLEAVSEIERVRISGIEFKNKIESLAERDVDTRRVVVKLNRAVTAHQEWLKELRDKAKKGE